MPHDETPRQPSLPIAGDSRLANSGRAMAGRATADLDIGVIYTHERGFMTPLVDSLARSGDDLLMRMILIDNASEDGVDEWSSRFPDTTVLRNRTRLGYAPNLNRVLLESTAPYILLLNTDMVFDPQEQCLSKMVRFMERHPECGISGCRLYHPDGSYAFPARKFQTLKIIAARRGGLSRWLGQSLAGYLYADRSHDEVFECDWLSGCLLLVRREAFRQVGYFDCRFGKYFEDVDICLRMSRAGWRVMFNGDTYAYHCEQRASKVILSRDGLQHMRSYWNWLRKWGLDPGRQSTASREQAA